ncbi:MAG TPA: 1-deoxy-D-xylulose-5-phosphate reductoisomerase [Solirubrobacteraceae bacterium]|nr:1-deoxy-D-xylulose-5-phosphate reductoisomerase [Solirubrobacteraceae bacterium]
MPRRVAILGSTGSIGLQALDVISRSHNELSVVALSASGSWETLLEQARRHGVRRVAIADPDAAAQASEAWTGGEVLSGPEGVVRLITDCECDMVLNAIVGSAGLLPTVAALTEGIDLALANKESLVVGGELVTALSQATGAAIIPVDSEHSALHQLLAAEPPGTVDRLILTASGGPFRGSKREDLADATVEQALAHPTWAMGGKITIDSATLMNKGLELIEAHHLFGTPYEQIEIVVHPQSIVHSLVQLCDGATLAHLGYPDMRVPISYALHHPDRVDVPVRPLDLVEVGALTFEPVDEETFSCVRLARDAAKAGGTAACTLNAANEVAVHAFLQGRLRFLDIATVIEETLTTLSPQPVHSFESLGEADAEARRVAGELVAERAVA